MALSGAEFKVKYPGPYYKFLRDDMTHHGFTYQLGLNIDTNKFNPSGECQKGGLYFFNDLKCIFGFYNFGPQIGIIEIPDDALACPEENKFKVDKLIISKIISFEDEILDLFKIARDNGCPWNEWICAYAAENGHFKILKWAREKGCPWNESTCARAAENGHLEILKWARENGCPWNSYTCLNAAKNGHLEILKWARANNCPWNKWTIVLAAKNDHLEILKWAIENDCPV